MIFILFLLNSSILSAYVSKATISSPSFTDASRTLSFEKISGSLTSLFIILSPYETPSIFTFPKKSDSI